MNFYGYKRPDGRVGVRNKVLILPASVCASDTTRIISQQVVGSVTFNNQLGCSQVAASAILTAILVPIITSWWAKKFGCPKFPKDEAQRALFEKQA